MLVYQQGDVESWAETLGRDFISTGDAEFSRTYVDGILQVTAEDVQAVAREYFKTTNRTVVVRRPGKTSATPTAEASKVERPQTRKTRLDNGLTLLVREDHQAPMVSVQAFFPGGLRYETPQDAGIGGIMAAMLTRGTASKDRLQIAQALEDRGASLAANSGRNSFGVGGTALAEDTEFLLSMAADCMRNPSFPEAELTRVRELTLAAIEAQQEDVDAVADRMMKARLFEGHPYALDPLGTRESVTALTLDQLIAHHRRILQPQAMVLAVYGDVDRAEVYRVVKDQFGDWPGGDTAALQLAPARWPTSSERSEQRDQQQGILTIGFMDRNWIARPLCSDVLDAAFSGVYYPGGSCIAGCGVTSCLRHDMGPVRGWSPAQPDLSTQPENAEKVEQIVEELVKAVQEEPPAEEELERAKMMCIAAHEVDLGSARQRVFSEALDELYGLGYDEGQRYAEAIEKVTAAEVQAAARKYMNLDRCVVVTTRPAEKGEDG